MPVPNKVGLHDASVRWTEADKTSLLNPDAISSYDKIVERKRGGCVEHDKSIGNCDWLQFPGGWAKGSEDGQKVEEYLEPEDQPKKWPAGHRGSYEHEN